MPTTLAKLYFGVFCSLLACSNRSHADHVFTPISKGDIQVDVAVQSPTLLPGQPIRIRIIVRNVSKAPITPWPPARSCRYWLRETASGLRNEIWKVIPDQAGEVHRDREDLMDFVNLRPNEETSGCVALVPFIGPGIDTELGARESGEPASPGRYQLTVSYTGGFTKDKVPVSFERSIAIDIKSPAEAEKAIADQILRRKSLRMALLASLDPPSAEVFGELKDLLKLYPKKKHAVQPIRPGDKPYFVELDDYGPSSYAPYIHFALARYYAVGKFEHAGKRVGYAMAADELDHVIRHPFAFHVNALILTKTTRSFDDDIKKMLVDHYTDTPEFLEKAHFLFENDAWWVKAMEDPQKFRKTIPKPYPPAVPAGTPKKEVANPK